MGKKYSDSEKLSPSYPQPYSLTDYEEDVRARIHNEIKRNGNNANLKKYQHYLKSTNPRKANGHKTRGY